MTINIIIISILFGALFYEYKEKEHKYLFKKYKSFVILIIILFVLILFTLLINIIIFLIYKFFNNEINNESEKNSINSKSTKESDNIINYTIEEIINDKIYFHEKVIENITLFKTDSYSQTIH